MESTAPSNTPGVPMPTFVPGQSPRPSGSIGQMATQAIKAIVPGYVAGEPKRFSDSLKKNFAIGLKDGYQFVHWTPATLGGATNPADLMGAPASFYHHASARIAQAREQLRQLEPMCEADHENCCEDIRLVIRAKLDELECAFGADCGPCEEWVEEIFVLLLGNDADDEIGEDQDGLIGQLEDDYTEENAAYCPEEEVRLAKIRLFRSVMISLSEEWRRFADDFVRGERRSASLIVQRLGNRTTVIGKSITIIREGLLHSGYSAELLAVELLDEGDDDEGDDGEPLTACCAMTRLEAFASTRAPNLLQSPGPGAFLSLATESRQLTRVACSVRGWLMGKLINPGELDECLGARERIAAGNRAWIKAAEGTGAISLTLRGVMAAAFTLWQQMRFFQADVETLLPAVTTTAHAGRAAEPAEERTRTTSRNQRPRSRAKKRARTAKR